MELDKGMPLSFVVFLLVSCFAVNTCYAVDETISGGGITTTLLGQSGKIIIEGKGVLLTFEVASKAEVDQNGTEVGKTGAQKHAVNSLTSQEFPFSTVNNASYFQGIRVINVRLSATLFGVNANLDIMLYLFLEDGNVTFGSETFKAFNGSLKFNIQLTDCTFCSVSENNCRKGQTKGEGALLDLTLEVKDKGGKTPKACSNKKSFVDDDTCPNCYSVGGSEVLLNKEMMIDDDFADMPADFPKFEIQGNKNLFVFRIPRFNNTALMDPVVSLEVQEPNPAPTPSPNPMPQPTTLPPPKPTPTFTPTATPTPTTTSTLTATSPPTTTPTAMSTPTTTPTATFTVTTTPTVTSTPTDCAFTLAFNCFALLLSVAAIISM